MSNAPSFFKRPFALLIGVFFASFLSSGLALSHPHTPAKLVPLEAETAYTFDYNGAEYSVYNTHLINFIGLERIDILDEDGNRVSTWWSRRGWCFTAAAFEAEQCMSQARYRGFFRQHLINKASASAFSGSGGIGTRSSILDDYPCLEKRVSSNTSPDVEMTAPDC